MNLAIALFIIFGGAYLVDDGGTGDERGRSPLYAGKTQEQIRADSDSLIQSGNYDHGAGLRLRRFLAAEGIHMPFTPDELKTIMEETTAKRDTTDEVR